jgi:hypothetical protein
MRTYVDMLHAACRATDGDYEAARAYLKERAKDTSTALATEALRILDYARSRTRRKFIHNKGNKWSMMGAAVSFMSEADRRCPSRTHSDEFHTACA